MAKEIWSDSPSGWWPFFRDQVHAFLLPHVRKTHRRLADLPARDWNGELYMGAI